ncbi:ATPP2-A13 [Panicum miliaceum]|uniref:ATPP2-A13 n=1 Tax=Panicum miliaceum TaxID=4540 RepID=A0A3L6QNU1_PANMI|nr:ATPP2-A13 [Panicum miliaceum]
MGAVASSARGGRRGEGTVLGDLPESCVAEVLLRLDPLEICRMARLSRTFRGAASGDGVWESKLPRNYARLLAVAAAGDGGERQAAAAAALEAESLPKKEVYARLCRRNRFDGGKKEFWLDKGGRGICMSISSMALSITGIDDRRYWNFIPNDESRFHTVAYLSQIWWFEVRGEVEFCFPEGRPFKRLGRRVCSSEHIHGWDIKAVRFQMSTSDGQQAQSKCYLTDPGVWINHHVGDFVVKDSSKPTNIRFAMIQIDCTHTKGGLCVDSVVEFWLDKGGRGVCMSISSMALSITGIDGRRYWNFIPNDESRCLYLLVIKTSFGNFVYACVEFIEANDVFTCPFPLTDSDSDIQTETDESGDKNHCYIKPVPNGPATRVFSCDYGTFRCPVCPGLADRWTRPNEVRDHVVGKANSSALRAKNKKRYSRHRVLARNEG